MNFRLMALLESTMPTNLIIRKLSLNGTLLPMFSLCLVFSISFLNADYSGVNVYL